MRGRIITALLALAAFCASFAAPLQPLFAAEPMSCCPSGKMSACCRRHHAAGWVGDATRCVGSCACAFPFSAGAPVIPVSHVSAFALPALTVVGAPADCADPRPTDSAVPFQRPPPARA